MGQLKDSLPQEEPPLDLSTADLIGTDAPSSIDIQSLTMDFCTLVNADMRVSTYNINGLTEQKLIFVLTHIKHFHIDIILLIDASTT